MAASDSISEHARRRSELGAFLRAKRSKLSPKDIVGFTGRRRVKGLRREEVAERAGIGVAWYTWLEQGRPINASRETLGKIARALQLEEQEERYVVSLVSPVLHKLDAPEHPLPSTLEKIVNGLAHSPALVLNECWDVLVANAAAEELFGPFRGEQENERNMIWRVFHDPLWRRLISDWQHYAQCSVAHLRGEAMTNPNARSGDLIEELLETSPEFATWWASHEVLTPAPNRKVFQHSRRGEQQFDLTVLNVDRAPHLRLFVYSSVDL